MHDRDQGLDPENSRALPESLHLWTMSVKYFCSVARRASNFSTVSMSTLCFVFGFGGSKGHVRMAMRASVSACRQSVAHGQ